MPYITKEEREQYDEKLDDLCFALDEYGYLPGHVTYVLYMIVARWFKRFPCYDTIANIRGVLLGTIAEFDRRVAAPYEDKKIIKNGDVDLRYHTNQGEVFACKCVSRENDTEGGA